MSKLLFCICALSAFPVACDGPAESVRDRDGPIAVSAEVAESSAAAKLVNCMLQDEHPAKVWYFDGPPDGDDQVSFTLTIESSGHEDVAHCFHAALAELGASDWNP